MKDKISIILFSGELDKNEGAKSDIEAYCKRTGNILLNIEVEPGNTEVYHMFIKKL